MRFRRGIAFPHPPRGPARRPYRMSGAAHRQRCSNLRGTRTRSDRESRIIKLLIWQACFDSGPRPTQRTLARQLGVWPSYVCKVQKQAEQGMKALASGRRYTLDNLAEARRFTERIRADGLLAPSGGSCTSEPRLMTTDEAIAEQWCRAREEQRKNPNDDVRRRVLFSVPFR